MTKSKTAPLEGVTLNNGSQMIPVAVTFNPFALATAQSTADGELAALKGCTIDDDDDARQANEQLRQRVTELDAVEKMWKEVKDPIKEAEKRIDKLFDLPVKSARLCVHLLRTMLEGYELLKRNVQREALAEASRAALLPGPEALHTALVAAADAAPTQLEGTSFVRTWKVKRYVLGLLPFSHTDQTKNFWVPDEKRVNAIGKAHKGDEPPPGPPGVVWEEDLSSRVRKLGK